MIIQLSEPIYNTSLKVIIGELDLFSKLFPYVDIDDTAAWYCDMEDWVGTIWMKKFDYITLDHELTHFTAWVGQYLWLTYDYKDELLTYLRWWYLWQILKKLKFKDLSIKLTKWKKAQIQSLSKNEKK